MADTPSTAASINPTTGKVDRITTFLWLSVLIFAAALVAVDKLFPNEGQAFQVMAGLATGFMGALLNRISPAPHSPESPAPPLPAWGTAQPAMAPATTQPQPIEPQTR